LACFACRACPHIPLISSSDDTFHNLQFQFHRANCYSSLGSVAVFFFFSFFFFFPITNIVEIFSSPSPPPPDSADTPVPWLFAKHCPPVSDIFPGVKLCILCAVMTCPTEPSHRKTSEGSPHFSPLLPSRVRFFFFFFFFLCLLFTGSWRLAQFAHQAKKAIPNCTQ
jgi:hypothetical protein